jgi:hypothetical protein
VAKTLYAAGFNVLDNCAFHSPTISRYISMCTKACLRLTCLMMTGIFYTIASVLCNEVYAQDTFTKEELAAQGVIVVEPKEEEGQRGPRGLVLGLRTGVAIPTGKVLKNIGSDASIGPIVNFEALYPLREWVRVGMMFEWHQHDINTWGPQFGTLGIFSLLPTVEFRPTREVMQDRGFEWFIPYASLGTGINFHSFSNATQLGNASVSFPNTFALRLAGGFDFPITSHLAFNTEVAWNRDSGSYKTNGAEADFNASSLNLLVGLRAQF